MTANVDKNTLKVRKIHVFKIIKGNENTEQHLYREEFIVI
jgi:hypothetical protein